MSCISPLKAYYSRRVNPDTGKRPVVFNVKDGYSDMPVDLPCGKCIGCAMVKRAEWAVRCYHESMLHEQNCFVTLTYDDEHLPSSLQVEDLQKFFRRLRDTGNKLRYFACGEYGSRTRRPHYHALIFGMDFLGGAEPMGSGQYFSPVLQAAWGKGHCSVGQLTMASACYVAGYVSKKMGDPDSFQVMSRRPGIGHGWLDKFGMDIFRNDMVTIDGHDMPVPKRYLVWSQDGCYSDYAEQRLKERKRYFCSMSEADKANLPRVRAAKELNYLARASMRKSKI